MYTKTCLEIVRIPRFRMSRSKVHQRNCPWVTGVCSKWPSWSTFHAGSSVYWHEKRMTFLKRKKSLTKSLTLSLSWGSWGSWGKPWRFLWSQQDWVILETKTGSCQPVMLRQDSWRVLGTRSGKNRSLSKYGSRRWHMKMQTTRTLVVYVLIFQDFR